MCLGIPAKIIEIENDFAKVNIGGVIIRIGVQLIENPQIGDYVIVHTGYALEKINEDEATETIEDIKKIMNPDNNMI
jgi:hydrogenase expression/formation protein HypC